jgi:hypothetical protein
VRILMVAARCYPFMGGIETHVHEVGQRVVARSQRIDLLTTDPGLSELYQDVLSCRLTAHLPGGAPALWAPAEGA